MRESRGDKCVEKDKQKNIGIGNRCIYDVDAV